MFFRCNKSQNDYGGIQKPLHSKSRKVSRNQFGLPSTVGIGPNMLLAKLCLDLEAKHSNTGIAKWTYDDVQTKLWPVKPLSKMWGIGPRMERNLNHIGIFNVGSLANYPLKLLENKFSELDAKSINMPGELIFLNRRSSQTRAS